MPAYTKSKLNSLTNSGLALEIADAPYDNDDQKINDFVNSKNWEFYVNACNSYGFMIDINAPWRLIADLDSEAMMGYASAMDLEAPMQSWLWGSRQLTIDSITNYHSSY